MKRRNEIVRRTTEALDVPGDLFPGMPLIELYGNRRVLIENHRGVAGYTCCAISICTDLGIYLICGKHLEIVNMTKHRLVVAGTIESVTIDCRR